MTIIDDYLNYYLEYSKKYGKYTCVLMQVGHFFEAYAVDNSKEQINNETMYHMANILNIQMTRKNKNILENSRGNPLMIGVNIYSIDKYIQLLLNKNYTIVLIEQVTEPPEPERKVTNIYSPGTYIENINKSDSNKCVSIFIEVVSRMNSNKKTMNVGISSIDLSTGVSSIYETHSRADDERYALDEIYRYLQSWNPKEILIVTKDLEAFITQKELNAYLDLNNHIVHFKQLEDHYLNLSYQKTFFEKIYKNSGMLSIHEYLDLEKYSYGTLSFMYILEFSYNHNESILTKIEKPEIIQNQDNLILTNNSINQLNLISQHHNNSVFDIINNTKTSLGKRYLKEMLLNPINDIHLLEKRYDYVETLQNNELRNSIVEQLKSIVDIERLHRKITLKCIQPADFIGLIMSYNNINTIIEIIEKNNILKNIVPSTETLTIFKQYQELLNETLNMDIIGKYHLDKITSNFFNEGKYENIDAIQNKLNEDHKNLKDMASVLSYKLDETTQMIKLDNNDRDGYFLNITSKRAELLKKCFKNMNKHSFKISETLSVNPGDFEIKSINKTQSRISSNIIRITSQRIRKNEYDIGNSVKEKFIEFLEYLDENYIGKLKPLFHLIGNLDTFCSIAYKSNIYSYTRPKLVDCEHSYCSIKDLRHPLIERIQEESNYITNDIELGTGKDGMLLYGTNASGKSSLMKAIGCNIILAQAGFFVASREFTLSPYKYLFTRINNNDNLFKGLSSFAVEMCELRNILKRCNRNSLVLGDELCAGTESISALSIFAASVKKLAKMRANFVFATHLHELSKMECITSLENVCMYHLKVIFDENSGKLIYDRKLTEGSGNSIYGLEVCKSMDMDQDFLEDANNIRQEIMGLKNTILEYKPSKYNSKLIVDTCEICQKEAEDTHHIKFQNTANENNIIDGFIQKDTKSNLVPLCKECHVKVHNNSLVIHGYIETSAGRKLKYERINEKQKKSNKKYDDIQLEIIKEFIEKNNKVNNKTMCVMLNNKHQIKISCSTLGKIKNNSY